MAESFLTVTEAAKLLEVTEQAVRKNTLLGKYGTPHYVESDGGGGLKGRALRISLDALPRAYQLKYLEQHGLSSDRVAVNAYEQAPEWARQRANQNQSILTAYETYLEGQPGKVGQLTDQFISEWNQEHPEEAVSRPTLYRWKRGFLKDGISALLPRYGSKTAAGLDEELWAEFMRLLKQNIKISECHRILELLAKQKGVSCPSDDTLRRMVRQLPEAVRVAIQEGKKAFYNKCQTYTRRDPESIRAGQIFVGDHRKFDFFILGPNGTWVRPWVTAWLDMRSGKLVSWLVTFNPCTDTIMSTFAEAALNPAIGLPREIYIDNGRDYCNGRFAGRGFRDRKAVKKEAEKVLKEEGQRAVPMLERLGVVVHFAIPENARAKTIERVAFLNMSNWFDPHFETYCGRNSASRPEALGDKLKKSKKGTTEPCYNVSLEELTQVFDGYVTRIYNKRVSERGRGRAGECPDETFMRTRLPVRRTSEAVLQHFLQKRTGVFKIGRNGITYQGREYYSPDAILYKGRSAIISARQNDPDRIFVFDLDERPLFVAKAVESISATAATPDQMHDEGARKSAEWAAITSHPAYVAANSGPAISMGDIVKLFSDYGPQAPDVKPTNVTEILPPPESLRDALRFNTAQQRATGTDGMDGMSVFELMSGTKIIPRKG